MSTPSPVSGHYTLIAETGKLGTYHGPIPSITHYTMSAATGTLTIRPPPVNYVMAAA